jgi:ABC-type polar amino acid transport system ATPase subunit
MIHVEGLTKRFGSVNVLDGIDHLQASAEAVVLIGPSGCGKSTFLRCLNQLERPDAGRITIDGLTLEAGATVDRERQRQLRLRSGMVFQQFHLFPHRTALENIMEGPLHVLKESRTAAESRARALLQKVGLSDRADHLPSQLSGGQQQRVAIARALAMRPRVMLFDEPTSALDPELRGEVLSVLRELRQEGMTMLVITHEMEFAREIADRVLFFNGGRVLESGPPEQVLLDPVQERTREFLRKVRTA